MSYPEQKWTVDQVSKMSLKIHGYYYPNMVSKTVTYGDAFYHNGIINNRFMDVPFLELTDIEGILTGISMSYKYEIYPHGGKSGSAHYRFNHAVRAIIDDSIPIYVGGEYINNRSFGSTNSDNGGKTSQLTTNLNILTIKKDPMTLEGSINVLSDSIELNRPLVFKNRLTVNAIQEIELYSSTTSMFLRIENVTLSVTYLEKTKLSDIAMNLSKA